MAERTLLVLAASTYQLDTISQAKAQGLRVLTTDNRPDNPGHRLADRSFNVDTTDRNAVLALARDEQIAGVIAPGTDVALTTLAFVADALGLPGPPPRAAEVLTDKLAFRAFQQAAGLPFPAFSEWTADRQRHARRGIGPWIVKPNRASGSKGIRVTAEAGDLGCYSSAAAGTSIDGRAIVEEYLEGSQHTVEGFLARGAIAFSLVTDRLTAARPYTATTGHRVPSRLAAQSHAEVLRQLEHVFAALGVRDGPFDCDFVATEDRVVLLEATPRLGGNSLSRLVRACSGFNVVGAAIHYACAEPLHVPAKASIVPSAVLILGVMNAGSLSFDVDALTGLRREPWVRYITIDKSPGSPVSAFVDGRARIGEAIVQGRTRAEVDTRAEEIIRRLRLDVRVSGVAGAYAGSIGTEIRSASQLAPANASCSLSSGKTIGSDS